jgi:hypothetical protein
MAPVADGGPLDGLALVFDPGHTKVRSGTGLITVPSFMGDVNFVSHDDGNPPSIIDNVLAGKPVARYTAASSDRLRFGDGADAQSLITDGSSSGVTMLTVFRSSTNSQEARIVGLSDTTTDAQFFCRITNDNKWQVFGQGNAEGTQVETTAAVTSGSWAIGIARFNSVAGRVEGGVNTTDLAVANEGSPWAAAAFDAQGTIGAFGAIQVFGGDIAYSLLFRKAIGNGQLLDVYNFVKNKFGL